MTKREKNLLLALSLGDGFLSKDGNAGKLYLCHGEKQLSYLQHKVNLVSSILNKDFNVYKTESKFGITWRSSMYHRYFGILRNLLKGGKKLTISPNGESSPSFGRNSNINQTGS